MNQLAQVTHIFRKDVRRHWPYILLFAGVLAADAMVDTGGPTYISGLLGRVIGGIGVRGALFGLITVVLAALVVHEDDVSSRGAFWSSRPVAPLSLLGAKLLFVTTFLLVLPLAFQAVAILRVGSGSGLIYHLAESALYQTSVLCMVVLLAALTRDLRGTVLLGIVGYVGFVAAATLFRGDDIVRFGALVESRALIGRIWWIGAGAMLISLQFGMRRTRLTLAGLVVAIAGSALLSVQFPYKFSPKARTEVTLAQDVVPDLHIRDVLYTPANRTRRVGGMEGLEAVVTTTTTGLAFEPRMRSIRLQFKGDEGTTLEEPRGRPYNPVQRYVPELPGYSWFGRGDGWAQFDVRLVSAAPGGLAEAVRKIDEVVISAEFDAYQPEVVGRLPLEVGAALTTGPARVWVDEVEWRPEGLSVKLATSWVSSFVASRAGINSDPRLRMVLVNDVRKEFLLQMSGATSLRGDLLVLGGPKVSRAENLMRFELGVVPGTQAELTPDWFEDAHILLYRTEYVGTFEAAVTSDAATWKLPFRVSAVRTAAAGAGRD